MHRMDIVFCEWRDTYGTSVLRLLLSGMSEHINREEFLSSLVPHICSVSCLLKIANSALESMCKHSSRKARYSGYENIWSSTAFKGILFSFGSLVSSSLIVFSPLKLELLNSSLDRYENTCSLLSNSSFFSWRTHTPTSSGDWESVVFSPGVISTDIQK